MDYLDTKLKNGKIISLHTFWCDRCDNESGWFARLTDSPASCPNCQKPNIEADDMHIISQKNADKL